MTHDDPERTEPLAFDVSGDHPSELVAVRRWAASTLHLLLLVALRVRGGPAADRATWTMRT